jgi:hypothetical protein
MADGSLVQSNTEPVRHSDSYGFRALTQLRGKGDMFYVLETRSP